MKRIGFALKPVEICTERAGFATETMVRVEIAEKEALVISA